VDCYDAFPHSFSILFFYFFKIIFVNLFLNWADWEFSFVIFFLKTLLIATVFLRMFFLFLFFYDFLRNYLFLFYFLILSWLKITVTICEENTVTFLANYCGLLQCFFLYGFFSVLFYFSLKLSLPILFFKY
jgi:hypothetical protein